MMLCRTLSLSLNTNLTKRRPETTVLRALSLATRLDGLDKPTVWHEFSPLAAEHGAINLGQGAPDWDPPAFVIESMIRSIDPKYGRAANQYARSYAHMPLAKVLAEDYGERFARSIDPASEVATAVGVTNVLYCALQGLLNPGDEVILLEPFFDIYESQVLLAGGVPVHVPLRPQKHGEGPLSASDVFTLNLEELNAAVGPKTKLLLLNTPHNPTGKVFSRTELEGIAEIAQRRNVIVISDEVYEHILFDPAKEPHISIASFPGMYDRTLTMSSSGKTFTATGWKVGWAVGPTQLVQAVVAVQQWVNFSAPTPTQDAMAQALVIAREPFEGHDSYFHFVAEEYKRKRTLLMKALQAAGMTPVVPGGSFFIMADTSGVEFPASYMQETTPASPSPMTRDWAMSRWLTKEVGVTAIPPSAFFSQKNQHLAGDILRFAFCKRDEGLLEAHKRLATHFAK